MKSRNLVAVGYFKNSIQQEMILKIRVNLKELMDIIGILYF